MTDPYAPPAPEAASPEPDLVAHGEVRSALDQFLARLTDLGATPDELQKVADAWNALDPDDDPDPEAWTLARRTEFANASDDELLQAIHDTRAEYELGHTTEAEADEQAQAAALQVATDDALGRMAANVQSILAWVGDDLARAEAVLRLELAPEAQARRTLVGPLQQQLGWTDEQVADAWPDVVTSEPQAPDGTVVPPEAPEADSGAQSPASEADSTTDPEAS